MGRPATFGEGGREGPGTLRERWGGGPTNFGEGREMGQLLLV